MSYIPNLFFHNEILIFKMEGNFGKFEKNNKVQVQISMGQEEFTLMCYWYFYFHYAMNTFN